MQDKVHNLNHTDMAAECLDHMAAGIDGLYKTSCAGCETRSSRKYLVSSRANDSHSMWTIDSKTMAITIRVVQVYNRELD